MRKKKEPTAIIYTFGKYGKRMGETLDMESGTLYADHSRKTNYKEQDMTDDYLLIRSSSLRYLDGYIKTSEVKDIKYKYSRLNHLFRDDRLYISYNDPIEMHINQMGFEEYENYDIAIIGSDIVRIVEAIKIHSDIDIRPVKQKIMEKINYFKNKYPNDFKWVYKNNETAEQIYDLHANRNYKRS